MKKVLFLLLFSQYCFSQKTIHFDEKIYHSVDILTQSPSLQSIEILNKVESEFYSSNQAKTNNDFLALVILYCNKAYYLSFFGKNQQAINSYEKAWSIFQAKKLKNYDIVEFCLKPLGNLYTIANDFDSAENTIKQYYFIANKHNDTTQKISAVLNLSNAYQSAGKTDLAIDILLNTLHNETTNTIQKGSLYNNLGTNYFIKTDYKKAKEAFEKSVSLLSENQNEKMLSNAYRNLSKIYALNNDYKTATRYIEKSQLLFDRTLESKKPREIAKFQYEKAVLLFHQKKYSKANDLIQTIFNILLPSQNPKTTSLPNKNNLYPENILLDVLDLQAELFLTQQRPKDAIKSYELAFYVEELIQNVVISENSKIINLVRNRNRTEKCIEIYYSLFQAEKEYDYTQKAFLLAEVTKSSIIKNAILEKSKANPQEKQILIQLQQCNTDILNEQNKGAAADINLINEVIKKQNELMLTLKTFQKSEPKSYSEINLKDLFKKANQENATIISYFFGTKNLYSFTVSDNKINLNKLGQTANCKPLFEKFLSYFKNSNSIINDVEGYQKTGFEAYKTLKIPTTNSKNLIIIPDGLFNFMPFEALITEPKKTMLFEKMNYLMTDFQISYSNSIAFYLQTNKSVSKPNVLGVFPIFEKTGLALPYSKDELIHLKNNWRGYYLEKQNATYSNFCKNASQFSILHLSTHASAGDNFSPAEIRFYDRSVYYSELYNLDIHPNLVVLSACETGLGKWYKGEGAMSVARGFQIAGASNLLFSLWKVNDFSTSVYMQNFYHYLDKNHSYCVANQESKLEYLKNKSIPNTKKSPYYWAAFVYYGTIQDNNSNCLLYGGITITILLLGFYLLKNRFRKLKRF